MTVGISQFSILNFQLFCISSIVAIKDLSVRILPLHLFGEFFVRQSNVDYYCLGTIDFRLVEPIRIVRPPIRQCFGVEAMPLSFWVIARFWSQCSTKYFDCFSIWWWRLIRRKPLPETLGRHRWRWCLRLLPTVCQPIWLHRLEFRCWCPTIEGYDTPCTYAHIQHSTP